MSSNPTWRTSDDLAAAGTLIFSGLQPGVASAWQTVRLWNNFEAAAAIDAVQNGRLVAVARFDGDADFVGEGIGLLDDLGVEVEFTGADGGVVLPSNASPVRIGAGAYLEVPEIPDGGAITVRVRIHPSPSDDVPETVEVEIRLEDSASLPIAAGIYEANGCGILVPFRESGRQALFYKSGDAAPASPADDSVDFPDYGWLDDDGRPHALEAFSETFDDQDGAAQTLGAGEGYVAIKALARDGSDITYKGLKAAIPLDETDDPAVPADELPVARIVRDDQALIEAGDISEQPAAEFAHLVASGDVVTVGPHRAIVGPFIVRHQSEQQLTVTLDQVSDVYELQGGGLAESVGGEAKPAATAMLLGEATSDAVEITGFEDRRRFFPRPELLSFEFDAPATSDTLRWRNPHPFEVYLLPFPHCLALEVSDNGGGSSGNTEIDALVEGVSIYATAARRPKVAFDATTLRDLGFPSTLVVPARGLLELVVSGVPVGGSPAFLTVTVPVYH